MKKITIIDEDTYTLFSLQAKLSILGFEVMDSRVAGSKEEILRSIKIILPDYIILEIALNIVDGFSVLKTIKENNETVCIPIFVYSYLDDLEIKNKAINCGADYYFSKNNYKIDDFANIVHKISLNKS